MRKKIILISLISILLVFVCLITINSQRKASYSRIKSTPQEHTSIPIDISKFLVTEFHKLHEDGYQTMYRHDNSQQEILYNGHKIFSVQRSPLGGKIGFFFTHSNNSLEDLSLAIVDSNKKIIEVYQNDWRTSNWKWKNDDTVIIQRSCGTGCMMAYEIRSNSGKLLSQYPLYIIPPPPK